MSHDPFRARCWLEKMHRFPKLDQLDLELRKILAHLLLVVSIAIHFPASVKITGFAIGVAIANIGMPHRLARQLFAVSDGFFPRC